LDLIDGLVALALGLFFYMMRRFGTSLDNNAAAIIALGQRMNKVETTQHTCQESLEKRLKKGDAAFDALDVQVTEFVKILAEFRAVIAALKETQDKLEQRVWNDHERRSGADTKP